MPPWERPAAIPTECFSRVSAFVGRTSMGLLHAALFRAACPSANWWPHVGPIFGYLCRFPNPGRIGRAFTVIPRRLCGNGSVPTHAGATARSLACALARVRFREGRASCSVFHRFAGPRGGRRRGRAGLRWGRGGAVPACGSGRTSRAPCGRTRGPRCGHFSAPIWGPEMGTEMGAKNGHALVNVDRGGPKNGTSFGPIFGPEPRPTFSRLAFLFFRPRPGQCARGLAPKYQFNPLFWGARWAKDQSSDSCTGNSVIAPSVAAAFASTEASRIRRVRFDGAACDGGWVDSTCDVFSIPPMTRKALIAHACLFCPKLGTSAGSISGPTPGSGSGSCRGS